MRRQLALLETGSTSTTSTGSGRGCTAIERILLDAGAQP
jgi:hypothetical protein